MSTVPISTIVNVQISRQSQGVTQAGFGVPLILTDEDIGWGSERIRSYLNLDEVLDDFTTSTDTYKAAAAIFAQSPRVRLIKIGSEAARVAQVATIVFAGVLVTSNVVTVTIDGTVIAQTFTVDNATTLAALATQIQALASVVSAVSNGTDTITITGAIAGVPVEVGDAVVTLGAGQTTAITTITVDNHGPADDLAEITEVDDDWYGLIWIERNEFLVAEAALYIETKRKIFGTCSSDTDILSAGSTNDIAAVLSAANYERTFIIYNADTLDFADAAWMGRCFTFDPGNETWKFKTLATITADNLTSSQRSAAIAKNCNLYVTIGGVDMTEEGKMASGGFIDIIRGTDWLQARIEERIFSKLVNLPKIPFTDPGIAIIEAELRAVLENAIREGVLSGDPLDPDSNDRERATRAYIVSVPRAIDVSPIDKANRLLPDITFEAVLAGAIHNIIIQGTLTV
jgi:hypothetical protein